MKNDTKSPVWKISPWKSPWRFLVSEPLRATLSDQKAQGVVEEYINGVDLGEIARGIVNKEIQVYDGVTRFGAYKPDEKWQELFEGRTLKTLNQSTTL